MYHKYEYPSNLCFLDFFKPHHEVISCSTPALLFAASPTQAAADEITFTAISDQSLEKLTERANAVSAYLKDYIQESCGGIGVNFTYNAVENYDDAVSALIDNVADIGWYGGLTGVQVRMRYNTYI